MLIFTADGLVVDSQELKINFTGQGVHGLAGIVRSFRGQMGVAGGGQNRDMPKGFLDFLQVNTCLKHMGGEAVTQGMTGDFLLDAKLFNYLGHGGLDAASVDRGFSPVGMFISVFTVREDKLIVAVD